jgi:hypothetical protein
MIHKLLSLLVALFAVSVLIFLPCNAESDSITKNQFGNGVETKYGDTTREQILETRERRKRQLKNMIHHARRQLADYSAGEITLTETKKKELADQMDIFQRKLDVMQVELLDWVRTNTVLRQRTKETSILY